MAQPFTKDNAKNLFYGTTVFFTVLFLWLTFNTLLILPERDQREQLNTGTASGQRVVLGKQLWQEYDCGGCHSLIGEGAFFAPELGNVYLRYQGNRYSIRKFIRSRPSNGITARRSMPQFNLSENELDAIADFLLYTSSIDTSGWPPNKEG